MRDSARTEPSSGGSAAVADTQHKPPKPGRKITNLLSALKAAWHTAFNFRFRGSKRVGALAAASVSKTSQEIVMQKKLLAVALAGAFGAPAVALAQSSTVQVFGTMYVEYTVRADQGNAPGGAS